MDRTLLEKQLVHIAESVALLRRLVVIERLETDPVQLGFATYTLQTAVQAAIDVAAMIVADRKLGEPRTNKEMFAKLAGDGWIPVEAVDLWKRIVSFRNVVVHRYLAVDVRVVRQILEHHLDDLLEFVRSVRARAT